MAPPYHKQCPPTGSPPHQYKVSYSPHSKHHLALNISFIFISITLFTITLHTVTHKHILTPTPQSHTSLTPLNTLAHVAAQCSKSYFHNTNTHSRLTILILLLLAGDTGAIVNPGPYCPKYPCVLCARAVKWGQRAIQCDSCGDRSEHAGWYHVSCIGSFTPTYAGLVNNSVSWICDRCGIPNFSSSLFSSNPIPISNSFNILSEHHRDNPPNKHIHLTNPRHSTPTKPNFIHRPPPTPLVPFLTAQVSPTVLPLTH